MNQKRTKKRKIKRTMFIPAFVYTLVSISLIFLAALGVLLNTSSIVQRFRSTNRAPSSWTFIALAVSDVGLVFFMAGVYGLPEVWPWFKTTILPRVFVER